MFVDFRSTEGENWWFGRMREPFYFIRSSSVPFLLLYYTLVTLI